MLRVVPEYHYSDIFSYVSFHHFLSKFIRFAFFLFFLLIWSLLIGKSCYQQDDRKRYIYTYIYIFIRNTSYFRLKKGIKRLYKKGYEYRIFFPSFFLSPTTKSAIPPPFRKSSAINSSFVASRRDIGANLLLPTYDETRLCPPDFSKYFRPPRRKSKLERNVKRRPGTGEQ